MKKNFLVQWEVNVLDVETPREAALHAWNKYFQNSENRIANVFTVKMSNGTGDDFIIDLSDEIYSGSIKQDMARFLSEDEEHLQNIASALKEALYKQPGTLIDYIPFDKDGEMETIKVWEKLKFSLTVEEFCELVDIK